MKNVTVNTLWLLGVVKKNREAHRDEYEKAFEGYREECIRCLQENLDALKSGAIRRVVISEDAPDDHTKDYTRVLEMLNASVDDQVTLTAMEFSNFALDEWGWKEMWVTSNSKYLK